MSTDPTCGSKLTPFWLILYTRCLKRPATLNFELVNTKQMSLFLDDSVN